MLRTYGFALIACASLLACYGQNSTLGLPCTENGACFDGQVCGQAGVCVEPSLAEDSTTTTSTTTTGDGDTTESDADVTGSDEATDSSESGDGDGDGDGDTGDPFCGDGVAQGSENCDGMDLRGMTCAVLTQFTGGMLMCDEMCNFNTLDCCNGMGEKCKTNADCCSDDCALLLGLECN